MNVEKVFLTTHDTTDKYNCISQPVYGVYIVPRIVVTLFCPRYGFTQCGPYRCMVVPMCRVRGPHGSARAVSLAASLALLRC